jgi:hypothetical protein
MKAIHASNAIFMTPPHLILVLWNQTIVVTGGTIEVLKNALIGMEPGRETLHDLAEAQ